MSRKLTLALWEKDRAEKKRPRTQKTRWAISIEYRTKHGRWPGPAFWESRRAEDRALRARTERDWWASIDTCWYLEEVAESTGLSLRRLRAGAAALQLRPPGTEHFKWMIPRVGSNGEDNLLRLVAHCWMVRAQKNGN